MKKLYEIDYVPTGEENEESLKLTRSELIFRWRSQSKAYCEEVIRGQQYFKISFIIFSILITTIAILFLVIMLK